MVRAGDWKSRVKTKPRSTPTSTGNFRFHGPGKHSGVSHDNDVSATRPPFTVRFRHAA